jgi:hypothetical protein
VSTKSRRIFRDIYNTTPTPPGAILIIVQDPHEKQMADETHTYIGLIELKFNLTSMLVSDDPGRLGTLIYVFTAETQQLVGARHTSCTQFCTVETPQPNQGRHAHLLSYI